MVLKPKSSCPHCNRTISEADGGARGASTVPCERLACQRESAIFELFNEASLTYISHWHTPCQHLFRVPLFAPLPDIVDTSQIVCCYAASSPILVRELNKFWMCFAAVVSTAEQFFSLDHTQWHRRLGAYPTSEKGEIAQKYLDERENMISAFCVPWQGLVLKVAQTVLKILRM